MTSRLSSAPGRCPRAVALLLLAASGCAATSGAREPAPSGAPRELPADPALLARLPLAVAGVLAGNPDQEINAGPLQAALRRAAAREGFATTSRSPAPGDLVLRCSFDWTPPGGDPSPSLFVSLVLERDGERIDEVYLQQAEGFPRSEPELEALAARLTRQLARSPRTQGYLKELAP